MKIRGNSKENSIKSIIGFLPLILNLFERQGLSKTFLDASENIRPIYLACSRH